MSDLQTCPAPPACERSAPALPAPALPAQALPAPAHDPPAPGPADSALAIEHEALLQFLYLNPHGMAQFGHDGTIVMLNPAFACLSMPLLPAGAALGNIVELMAPYLPELRSLLGDPCERGMICDGVRVHLGAAEPGQDPRVLSLTVVRMDPDRHMAVMSDLTRQVAHERRLHESDAWFAAVVLGADDYAILGLDADGLISSWNGSAELMFGHPAAAVIGRHAARVVARGDSHPASFAERLREAVRDGWHLDEGWRTRADGRRFWGTCMISPVAPDAGTTVAADRFQMVVRDVTERQNSAEALRRALTADHLTGVLNRRCFLERAERELARQSQRDATCCIAMVDVDHFKSVNDSFGHDAGDAVLRSIADVLRTVSRGEDLVGRLGGEEFAVLMPATTPQVAMPLADTLRAGVAALRLTHGGQLLQVTASIGVSAGGADLKRLLMDADVALYTAKRSGRDKVCLAPPAS